MDRSRRLAFVWVAVVRRRGVWGARCVLGDVVRRRGVDAGLRLQLILGGGGGKEDVTGFWHCVLSTEALQGCQVTVGLRGSGSATNAIRDA